MRFEDFGQLPDDELDLLTGALLVARDAYPGLNLQKERARIDALADPLSRLDLAGRDPITQTQTLVEHLFDAQGFRGNRGDYYDPGNSYLNLVLDRKLGIPISLSVLFVVVADRIGVAASGVSFPGHFLVRVESSARFPLVVDSFRGGKVLMRSDLEQLVNYIPSIDVLEDSMLEPATTRSTLVRMLNNLRFIHARRGDLPQQLLVLDRVLCLEPNRADLLKERALLNARLGAPGAALADLERYLELAEEEVIENRPALDRLVKRLSRVCGEALSN